MKNKLQMKHSPNAYKVSGMSALVCVSKTVLIYNKNLYSTYQCPIELLMSIDTYIDIWTSPQRLSKHMTTFKYFEAKLIT